MRSVYLKLSIDNIVKNKKIYFPFILSSVLSIFLMYIVTSFKFNPNIIESPFGNGLIQILNFGSVIMKIFVFIFLFYTNSFIIRRRKKELGLYGILGMEKKHVAKVVFYELFIIYIISLVIGFFTSIVLDKLMYLLLIKMIGQPGEIGFYISFPAIFFVGVYITFIFVLMFINSFRYIHLSKPIALLNSSKVGEKEPKAKFLLSLIGIILIGVGYFLSLTTKNPKDAIPTFFIAVTLVILGTYILFTTVSIAILKMLKKSKSFYYKPENFISISGMIYRMKQNAVGLANIAILSTMVLVGVSTTFSLWVGVDDLIKTKYPKDMVADLKNVENINQARKVDTIILSESKKLNIRPQEFISYDNLGFRAKLKDGKISELIQGFSFPKDSISVEIGHLTDYNKNFNKNLSLKDNEIYVFSKDFKIPLKTLDIFGKKFNVKKLDEKYLTPDISKTLMINKLDILVNNQETFKKISALISEKGEHELSRKILFNTNTNKENDIKLIDSLQKSIKNEDYLLLIEAKSIVSLELKGIYAGIFFIGSFLSLLFLIATIIIMYYKQVAEGLEDKNKFEIMQRVGLDKDLIRKSINSQILTVFFTPLIVAGLHLIFAFPLITKLLSLLMLTNIRLFMIVTCISVIIFSIVYYAIYKITSKVYYEAIN